MSISHFPHSHKLQCQLNNIDRFQKDKHLPGVENHNEGYNYISTLLKQFNT